jgi:hypothetical protein
LGFDLTDLFGRVSLGVLVPNILSEEVWDVSRVGLGFLSNPKFRVLLRKVRCEPLFIIFLGFDLLSSPVSWCPCVEYFV